ncbi:LANO_0F14136g1_1 [Lachancea nothofagi CBS 11611]|uniref:RNA polymerase II subunit A C-terminal domain phosphatase n=1 Tax=Lachancea nothofagi CBS 11611 TaxID=1266666 RepID=A0A1G4KCE1_9SACH|nr:LANO_0F14136g1_1 [Lachancea nothofagi CBS 11611]
MTTPIRLPSNLPFPVTIAKLCVSTGDSVKKDQRLFVYKYWELQDVITAPNEEASKKKRRVDLIGTFDSPIEGQIVALNVSLGDEFVNDNDVIAEVCQPCSHDVTYGALCVVCGKAVDEDDQDMPHNGFSNSKLTMAHNNTNIKVSERQAASIEKTAQKQLRELKKLVLVVDLDQTVIHCGVDPTIKEWANDPSNPNYDALKNVKSFSLDEDPILPPFYMGPRPPARKCQYYVKLRPGLQEFFEKVAPRFELHIYTMATRAYALEIAKIIDPTGELFGDRILSRDENGSLTHKSLERLFPMDQSMVVIIDDRGDVWSWCPNLIKVVPYDFFVGVGDINSNFLPRQQNSMLHMGRRHRKKAEEEELLTDIMDTEKKLQEKIDQEVKKQEEKFNKITEEHQPERPISKEDLAKKLEHNASLEVQQQNRPLAELQKHMHNQKLLIDDDDELPHLSDILLKVHTAYYEKLAAGDEAPDIKTLMPAMKAKVLKGCYFVFSGLIPLGTNVRQADIALWTSMFGAVTSGDVNEHTTHIVTKTPGTFKARLAKAYNPNIKVVHPDWIFECLVKWERVNEQAYELITEQEVTQEELEEFKGKLEQKRLAEKAISEREKQATSDEVTLLAGNDIWLDNDDDEMDEFLNENDDDDENEDNGDEEDEDKGEERKAEDVTSTNVPQYSREASLETESMDRKRSLSSEDDNSNKRQHPATETADDVPSQDRDTEDDDDLEAELLLELEG